MRRWARALAILAGREGRDRQGVNSELVPGPRLLRPVASSSSSSREN